MSERILTMIDLLSPTEVEISFSPLSPAGTLTIWVNIDGVCRLRIVRMPASSIVLEGTEHLLPYAGTNSGK